MKSVRWRFVIEAVFSTWSDSERSRARTKSSETGRYVPNEQKVYTTREFGTERRMTSDVVLIRGESSEKKKVRVE